MKITPQNDIKLIDFIIKNSNANIRKFIVGGCVRDWFLKKKCYDIDFTFEDYPKEIAIEISKKYKMEINEFPQFLTIRLISKKRRIDLATFRKEIYPTPASLPKVEKAQTIEEDLKRRDFTVNSIALSINKNEMFKIFDPFNGIKDIEKGLIRILHESSFKDDPTRIFRAIRFSERFNWQIEPKTYENLINSKKYINLISSQRIRNEIIKILSEKKCYSMLKKILELKILNKDELFDFDEDIDKENNIFNRYIYIVKKNKSLNFFERYAFERKIKNKLKTYLK